MSNYSVKLQSSDGKIVIVDQEDIKQMGTIQTMLESLGDGDNNNEEVIPIYKVNGNILDKVHQWSKHHNVNGDEAESNNNIWSDQFLKFLTHFHDNKIWSTQFFMTNLENIFQLVEAADYLELNSLLTDGQIFIDKHLKQISATNAFKNLSSEKLGLLLARDSLNVLSEEIVFECLESWIIADPEERTTKSQDLLPHIRAHFLSCHFVVENINTFFLKHKHPQLSEQLDYDNKVPRYGYEFCIVALLQEDYTNRSARCLKYLDTKTMTWTYITDVPDEFYQLGCQLCSVGDNIYLVGGGHWPFYLSGLSEYNPRTNTWKHIAELQKCHSVGHSVCTLDEKIFVLSGYLHNKGTCEKLDLNDDEPKWKYIKKMKGNHNSGGAAVLGRKIFVLGGEGYKTDVEVYDVDQNQWSNVANMSTKRSLSPGVAALNNKIYVSGGCSGQVHLSSAECYDPETNIWSEVASMNFARVDHALVSLYGKLYAIGGGNSEQKDDSVEVYDPCSNNWTLYQHNLEGLVSASGACLIKKSIIDHAMGKL